MPVSILVEKRNTKEVARAWAYQFQKDHRSHGGTIWVESEGYDDERFPGTKFHILIPVRRHPPDDKSAAFRSLHDRI
jgi:hypothetical protein